MKQEKMGKEKTSVAAFDFDKTITRCDTFIPFLLYFRGFWGFVWRIPLLLPALIAFFCGKKDRQELKEAFLIRFIGGVPIGIVEERAQQFAMKWIPSLLRSSALERLRWHRDQGHMCVLVSASLSLYLLPWGLVNGFTAILATSLQVDSHGRVTGRIAGKNCRGPEKVRRLHEVLGTLKDYEIYAYGDSAGDRELLAVADHPYYREIPTSRG